MKRSGKGRVSKMVTFVTLPVVYAKEVREGYFNVAYVSSVTPEGDSTESILTMNGAEGEYYTINLPALQVVAILKEATSS